MNNRKSNKKKRSQNAIDQLAKTLAKTKINPAPKLTRKRPRQKQLSSNSIAQVERRLQSSSQIPRNLHPYVKCRMDPFSAAGSSGIPDGGNANYVVVDSTIIDNITDSGSEGFVIQTASLMPMHALITPLNTIGALSTVKLNGTAMYAASLSPPSSLYGAGVPANWKLASSAPGNDVQDPYSATSYRVVAIQYKLTYTGPPLSASGTYTITPNTFSCTPGGSVGDGVSSAINKGVFLNGNNSTVDVPNGTIALAVDGDINPTVYVKDSCLSRIDRPVVITPRHKTDKFNLNSINTNLSFYTANRIAGAVPAKYISRAQDIVGYYMGIWGHDNDWQHFQIVVSGYAPGSSFVLETAVCYEYSLANTSSFAPLAKKQSEMNAAALAQAQKIVNSTPTGVAPR